MTQEKASAMAAETGFTNHGIFMAGDLRFRQEVRDMCSADRCGKYNKSWTCPPACGSLAEIQERASDYRWGILLQSTGQMEDAYDAETLMEAMESQKNRFAHFCDALYALGEDFLPMSSGGCEICPQCTYPQSPCRFPEKAVPSMEAYGLLVNDTCQSAGIPYYYGKNTITFSSCVLFK